MRGGAEGSTPVSNGWIAERLVMGHPESVSQMIGRLRSDSTATKLLKRCERMLKSND